MTQNDAEVAIIGYGPSGVSAANFLGARGVRTMVFERDADIYQRARAVTVNDWTMRCYQSVGLDAGLRAVMDETLGIRWITYAGQELDRVVFPPSRYGHAGSYAIYQPAMEQVLRAGVARFADHVTVETGSEVTAIAQDAEGVTLSVGGSGRRVRAGYVLACDGGSSQTRERLGIGLIGSTEDVQWVVIDARVKRWWPNRGIVTFWCDSARPVNDIALALGNHRWEFPLEPHESREDFATHDQLWRLLATMGITEDQVEIHQHAFYRHHVRRAGRWRAGRVMLVGDAAHLMPPWIGQGMQSGVRDAHNLAWKLAEVVAGRLPETVLDSYEAERWPDVEARTQMSIGAGRVVQQRLTEAEQAAMAQAVASGGHLPLALDPALSGGWLTGTPAPGCALGAFIPQPRMATAEGRFMRLDDAIGPGFALLGDHLDPASLLSAEERAGWDRLGAGYHAVRAGDAHAHAASDLIDLDGTMTAWLRAHGARVVAVRPDRFVAATDAGGLRVPP